MKQVDTTVSVSELSGMAQRMYGDLVKAVVDIERGLLVIDAELQVDEEQHLLEHGSKQSNLWGINLHPGEYGTDAFVEFDSLVNIRPSQGNMSRDVDDAVIRKRIVDLVGQKVTP